MSYPYQKFLTSHFPASEEFGKTFQEMKDIEQRKSPLQIKMDELGKKLSIFSFAIIACIMALGIFQGKTFLSMFNIGSTQCGIHAASSFLHIIFVLYIINGTDHYMVTIGQT